MEFIKSSIFRKVEKNHSEADHIREPLIKQPPSSPDLFQGIPEEDQSMEVKRRLGILEFAQLGTMGMDMSKHFCTESFRVTL